MSVKRKVTVPEDRSVMVTSCADVRGGTAKPFPASDLVATSAGQCRGCPGDRSGLGKGRLTGKALSCIPHGSEPLGTQGHCQGRQHSLADGRISNENRRAEGGGTRLR